MNRGTPPTGPNARTGEFTPPGVTSTARANSSADRSSVTGLAFFLTCVNEVLEQSQPVRELDAGGTGGRCPGRRQPGRLTHPAYVLAGAVPGRRGEHVAVPA